MFWVCFHKDEQPWVEFLQNMLWEPSPHSGNGSNEHVGIYDDGALSRSIGNFARGKFLNLLLFSDVLLPHLVAVKVFAKFSHDFVHDCPVVEDGEVELVLLSEVLQFVEYGSFPYPGYAGHYDRSGQFLLTQEASGRGVEFSDPFLYEDLVILLDDADR